jgi:hypothetical protein
MNIPRRSLFKQTCSPRPLALTLVLGLLSLASANHSSAQATDSASTNAAPKPMPSALDNDDMVRLQKARTQVLGTHPDLKAEEERLKALHDAAQNQPAATADQKTAMVAEWKAYQKKMRAAMLAVDPTLGPLFTKLDEARKHGGATSPFQPAAK